MIAVAGLLIAPAHSVMAAEDNYSPQTKGISGAEFDRANQSEFWSTQCSAAAGTDKVTLAGDNNIEKILNFMMEKGLTLAQASGFIGNMQQESGVKSVEIKGKTFREPTPEAVQNSSDLADENYQMVSGTGFGLVQWTWTDRQAPLEAKAREMDNKKIIDIGVQLEYVWDELNAGWKSSTLDPLKSVDDPVEAAVLIHDNYEISGDTPDAVLTKRGAAAKEVYDMYKDAPPAGTMSSSSSGSTTGNSGGGSSGGSSSSSSSGGSGELGKVYVLGDSITHAARDAYQTKLTEAGATEVKINASGGRNLGAAGTTGDPGSGYEALETDKEAIKNADNVVIALGTNQMEHFSGWEDAGGYTAKSKEAIKKAMDLVKAAGGDGKVYWVDVAISSAAPTPYPSFGHLVDNAIHSSTSDGYKPIEWSKVVDPQYNPAEATGPVNDADRLLSDGIHPTTAGTEKLVDTVIDALKSGGGEAAAKEDSCGEGGKSATTGDIATTTMAYAWETYRGDTLEMKPAYKEAIDKSKAEGRYHGDCRGACGVDCGVFTTHLIRDSGHDPGFNSEGKGGATSEQEAWMREHWEPLGSGPQDPANLKPGDIAVNPNHTFAFVGEIDGFESNIASASWGNRAPMAGGDDANEDGFNWYRKK